MKGMFIAVVLLLAPAPAVSSVTPIGPERSPVCTSNSVVVERITIRRAVQEGPYQEQWAELERAVGDAGWEVGVVVQEERRMDESSWEAIDAILRVGKEIASDALLLSKLVELIGRHLKGRVRIGPRRDQVRIVKILGPNGETLSEVEVPDD